MWDKITKGVNEASGKVIGKEGPQRSSVMKNNT
jgi:hypothetical protein